jgi:TolB protein
MWARSNPKSVVAVIAVTLAASSCTSPEPNSNATETPATATRSPSSEASPSATLPISGRGWIAYQAPQGSTPDRVFLVHIDGSGDHPIAQGLPGSVAHPDFSRDGSRLVFEQLSRDTSHTQIYVATADGAKIHRIALCKPPSCLDHYAPSWSPDGKQLAISTDGGKLTSDGPTRFGLAIIDVASEEVHPIVDHPAIQGQDLFPRWSPDGKQLVFWRDRFLGGSVKTAIFIVNADGSGLQQLTPWSMLAGDPDWSPDGSLIVFTTHPLFEFSEGEESELYTMRPDGSEVRALTSYGPDGPRATQPRWTPDGKAILYTRLSQAALPREIWVINGDGTGDVPVLDTKSIYTHPVLQPS